MPIRFGFASVATAVMVVAALSVTASVASAETGSVTVGGATSFPPTLVGSRSKPQMVVITNDTASPVSISVHLTGGAILDFFGSADCATPELAFAPIPVGGACTLSATFLPGALGVRATTLRVDETALGTHQTVAHTGTGVEGYYLAGASGEAAAEGGAADQGNLSHSGLRAPIVGSAVDANGYWLVASDGGVFSFGDAGFFGSTGAVRLTRPIVGMAATSTGLGYWLVASDGGIFSFGDAGFFGSTGAVNLTRPIVAMAPTPTRRGYWLVASDGGVFSFGDAPFLGSLGGRGINDIVDIASASGAIPDYLLDAPSAAFVGGARPSAERQTQQTQAAFSLRN